MYSSSSNSGYFSTNGQPSHGYMDPFYAHDGGTTSSQNEALMPPVTSSAGTKSKSKQKSGKCCCCKCDLASRSGHSLLAILANLIVALIAIVCMFVVISALIEQKPMDEFVDVLTLYPMCLWTTAAILLLTILFALFGLYADLTERKIPLKVFLVFAALVVIGFLFTAVVSLVTRSQLEKSVHDSFNATLTNDYGTNDGVTKALDKLHQRNKCCGASNYVDWKYSSWLKQQTEVGVVSTIETKVGAFGQPVASGTLIFAPDSCCKTVLANCGYLLHPNNLYETGCAQTIHEVYDRNLIKLAVIGFVLAFFELLAFVSSLYLLNRVRKQLVWQWY